jgi:hypothetical protein
MDINKQIYNSYEPKKDIENFKSKLFSNLYHSYVDIDIDKKQYILHNTDNLTQEVASEIKSVLSDFCY